MFTRLQSPRRRHYHHKDQPCWLPLSDGKMNGFGSPSSDKIESCERSLHFPASQGWPLKQWMCSSSLPSFARFSPQYLKELIISFNRLDQASRIQSTIFFLESAFKFPASVCWCMSSLIHWSCNSVTFDLKVSSNTSGAWINLVHPPVMTTWSTLNSLNSFFTASVILHWYESHTSRRRLKENAPTTLYPR